MGTVVEGLPVAAGVLDGLEQRLFGGSAARAAVAGHFGVGDAEFGAAAGDLLPQLFESDRKATGLVISKRHYHPLF